LRPPSHRQHRTRRPPATPLPPNPLASSRLCESRIAATEPPATRHPAATHPLGGFASLRETNCGHQAAHPTPHAGHPPPRCHPTPWRLRAFARAKSRRPSRPKHRTRRPPAIPLPLCGSAPLREINCSRRAAASTPHAGHPPSRCHPTPWRLRAFARAKSRRPSRPQHRTRRPPATPPPLCGSAPLREINCGDRAAASTPHAGHPPSRCHPTPWRLRAFARAKSRRPSRPQHRTRRPPATPLPLCGSAPLREITCGDRAAHSTAPAGHPPSRCHPTPWRLCVFARN